MQDRPDAGLRFPSLLAPVLASCLAAACGGAQSKPPESASGLKSDSTGSPTLVPQPVDQPQVSAEEREDFGKAMERLIALRSKGGELSAADCQSVLRAFETAWRENPGLKAARFNQAALMARCGKGSEAQAIFEELAFGKEPYAPALTNLGLSAWDKGDRSKAEQLFAKAIEVDPNLNSATARNNLSQLLRDKMVLSTGEARKQHASQAIRHLRTVLAVDGNNIQAYATLAYIYYEMGLDEMSKLVGEQAIARAEEVATGRVETLADESLDSSSAQGGRGRKGRRGAPGPKSQSRKRIQAGKGTGYTEAMNQQLALVYNTLGLVQLRQKNVTGALKNFSGAISKNPELFEARLNRAAISINFRDYATAEQDFKVVLQAQPQNYEALIGLGVALRGNKKVEEAEQTYLSATKLMPEDPRAYYNLGLLYQDYRGSSKPELEKAQSYYRDFLAKSKQARKQALVGAAKKRIRDIDEMFVALAEAEKLQREYEEMLRKAEEQQKQMEAEEGAEAPAENG